MPDEALLKLLADQTVVLQELAKQIAVNKLDNDALQTNATLEHTSSIKCTERATKESGDPLSLAFETECSIAFKNINTTGICCVTDILGVNVVGNDWLVLFGQFDVLLNIFLNQITKMSDTSNQTTFLDEFTQEFLSVFDSSVGNCNKTTVTMCIEPDAKPVFRSQNLHPVSYASTSFIDTELDRLLELGVFTLVSYPDTGTQFQSAEFDKFFTEELIYNIHNPLQHPRSHGQAARFVDTFKRALNKAKGEESIPNVLQTFLQRYRMTPNAQLPNNCSPAEVMFGRKLHSTLDLVKPRAKFDIVRDNKMEHQFNVKHGAKSRIFYPNQKVYIRDFRDKKVIWTPAVIIERSGTVVYNVECDGNIWRRHANQIRVRYEYVNEESSTTLSLLYDTFDTGTTKLDHLHHITLHHRPTKIYMKLQHRQFHLFQPDHNVTVTRQSVQIFHDQLKGDIWIFDAFVLLRGEMLDTHTHTHLHMCQ